MAAAGGIGMAEMFAKQLGEVAEARRRQAADPIARRSRRRYRSRARTRITRSAALHRCRSPARPSSGYGMRADPVHGSAGKLTPASTSRPRPARRSRRPRAAPSPTPVRPAPTATSSRSGTTTDSRPATRTSARSTSRSATRSTPGAADRQGRYDRLLDGTAPPLRGPPRRKAFDPEPLLPLQQISVPDESVAERPVCVSTQKLFFRSVASEPRGQLRRSPPKAAPTSVERRRAVVGRHRRGCTSRERDR